MLVKNLFDDIWQMQVIFYFILFLADTLPDATLLIYLGLGPALGRDRDANHQP